MADYSQLVSPLNLSSPMSLPNSDDTSFMDEEKADDIYFRGLLWPTNTTDTIDTEENAFKIYWQDHMTIHKISSQFMLDSFPSLRLANQASHPIASKTNWLAQLFKEARRLNCWDTLHLVLKYLDLHVYTLQADFPKLPRMTSVVSPKLWLQLTTIQKIFTSRALLHAYNMYEEAHYNF